MGTPSSRRRADHERREGLMPGDPHYAAEKFAVAVHRMAVSEKPLRERLYDAHREFTAVGEEDFPDGSEVRADFVGLMARMTWAESKGAGTLPATLALVSDSEARRLAQLVCDIDSRLEDWTSRFPRGPR
jgi:hypothetical protein